MLGKKSPWFACSNEPNTVGGGIQEKARSFSSEEAPQPIAGEAELALLRGKWWLWQEEERTEQAQQKREET